MARWSLIVLLAALWISAPRSIAQVNEAGEDYAVHFNRGDELARQGRFRKATDEFHEAVRLNPNYIPAHQALAMTYAATGNVPLSWREVQVVRAAGASVPDELVAVLQHEMSEADAVTRLQTLQADLLDARVAANEHPKDADKQLRLAAALNDTGYYGEAQKEVEGVLKLNPGLAHAHFLLGKFLAYESSTRPDAIPHLLAYLDKASPAPSELKDTIDAYRILGNIYLGMDDPKEALAAYEKGLKLGPDEAEIWNNAAWIYATSTDASVRDFTKALVYAQRAVELSGGKQATYLDTLAEALYLNGKVDRAIDTESQALALDPDSSFMQNQLAKFRKAKQSEKRP